MSTTTPVLDGTPLATAEEVERLRAEVAELKAELKRALAERGSGWRAALEKLQETHASMSEEAKRDYDEACREAHALLNE